MTDKQKTRERDGAAKPQSGRIFLFAGGGVLLLLLLFLLFKPTGREGITVGFYGIPKEYREAFQDLVEKDEAYGEISWRDFSEDEVLSRRITREVDLLIGYNGYLMESLTPKALTLSSSLGARYPRSLRESPYFSPESEEGKREFKIMPILLNHYETAYFEVMQRRSGLPYPRSLEELENYAIACREWVETPMVCAGGEDENLFLLVSLLAESLAGAEGYESLVHALREQSDFAQVLNIPLEGKAPEGSRFGTLLDLLKEWQREGLLLADWYEADEPLVTVFMEDNHAALVFMSLEEHRDKPFQSIKYFQANPFPPAAGIKEATVEPAISALIFYKTELTENLLSLFSSEVGQESLSAATRLGPAALKGAAFDIQADDARFFAAASPGGPVPDLGRAAFLSENDRAKIATQIRSYLSHP